MQRLTGLKAGCGGGGPVARRKDPAVTLPCRPPSHAGAHRYRAAAWWKLGDPAASAGDFEKAISNSERPSPSLYRSLVITQFASGADYYPAAVTTVDAALQRFPVEVSLLGLAVDLALERSDTGAATVYMSRLPARLAGLNQWQFRAALLACMEGQADVAKSTFAKLASDTQGNVRHRSGTWNVSVEILSGWPNGHNRKAAVPPCGTSCQCCNPDPRQYFNCKELLSDL